MIADRAGVVTDHGHRLVFHFAFVVVEIRRALQNIPGVNQKGVRIVFTHAFY